MRSLGLRQPACAYQVGAPLERGVRGEEQKTLNPKRLAAGWLLRAAVGGIDAQLRLQARATWGGCSVFLRKGTPQQRARALTYRGPKP